MEFDAISHHRYPLQISCSSIRFQLSWSSYKHRNNRFFNS